MGTGAGPAVAAPTSHLAHAVAAPAQAQPAPGNTGIASALLSPRAAQPALGDAGTAAPSLLSARTTGAGETGNPSSRLRPVPRLLYLGGFLPAAVLLDLLGAPAAAVFACSALAVIPAAALMSDATEQLAEHSGPGVAGLLNVTFGNAPELIIAVFALADGLHEVVKASLVGSVTGNALLVLGAAMLAGGRRRTHQLFSARAARAQAATLLAGAAALAIPSLLQLARGDTLPVVGAGRRTFGGTIEAVSIIVAVVLIVAYAAGLLASLRAHRGPAGASAPAAEPPRWSARRAGAVLAGASVLVAIASDTLVGSVEHASSEIGLSQFFIGSFVVAIVGNAAEHWVAVIAATKDKMDLAVGIAVGSASQVGLLLAPLVAILSLLIGPQEMPLVFNGYELAGLVAAGWLAAAMTFDGTSTRRRGAGLLAAAFTWRGRSTWRSGAALIGAYGVLGVVFLLA